MYIKVTETANGGCRRTKRDSVGEQMRELKHPDLKKPGMCFNGLKSHSKQWPMMPHKTVLRSNGRSVTSIRRSLTTIVSGFLTSDCWQ